MYRPLPNFIRIDGVLWKIWQHFGVFFFGSQCSFRHFTQAEDSLLRANVVDSACADLGSWCLPPCRLEKMRISDLRAGYGAEAICPAAASITWTWLSCRPTMGSLNVTAFDLSCYWRIWLTDHSDRGVVTQVSYYLLVQYNQIPLIVFAPGPPKFFEILPSYLLLIFCALNRTKSETCMYTLSVHKKL